MEIEFNDLPKEVHHCTSYRLEDTIIWKCPICPNYERKLNLNTGEMSCVGKTEHQHTGFSNGSQNMNALTLNLSEQ